MVLVLGGLWLVLAFTVLFVVESERVQAWVVVVGVVSSASILWKEWPGRGGRAA